MYQALFENNYSMAKRIPIQVYPISKPTRCLYPSGPQNSEARGPL